MSRLIVRALQEIQLARKFSIWKKKLGHRQSGSQVLGGVGGVMFFALLTVIASILLTILVTYQFQSWLIEVGGYSWWGFILRLLPILTLLGVGATQVASMVLTFGASAERRSALVKMATELKVIDTLTKKTEFPYVPRESNISNSPGTRLKYRLPVMHVSAWRFFAISALCLVLVAIAAALSVVAYSDVQLSSFGWATWAMSIVFFIAAGLAIYAFLWELLTYSGLGPTCIEISDHPLIPGKRYEVFLSQAGRMRLKQLELKVICKEEVTYQQGTDIRKESKVVRQIRVFNKTNIRIDPDLPYEAASEFTLPTDAMHSFQSSHNVISWMLMVDGEIEGWPPFQRIFPVVVYPAHTGVEN